MRHLGTFLLFAASVCAAQVTPASRRYAEKTPLQYAFGPFKAVAPYNNSAGYSAIGTDNQFQPSTLVTDTNTFAATANFTELSGGALSFSTASNVGTVSNSGSSGVSGYFQSNAGSAPVPIYAVQATVNQNGTATGTGANYDVLDVGVCESGSPNQWIVASLDHPNHFARIEMDTGGTYRTLATVTGWVAPSTPWRLGFTLVGSVATYWYNTGGGWNLVTQYDVSTYYQPKADGNFSGWKPCFGVETNQTTSWQVSNLISGTAGGAGLGDFKLVTYPDGRPYVSGTTAYFLADVRGAETSVNYQGVFSYDLSAGTLSQIGTITDDRGGQLQYGQAADLIYDTQNGQQYIVMPEYSGSSPFFYYLKIPIGTMDLLSTGNHVLTGTAVVTLPGTSPANQGQDPDLVCVSWNYSAGTCGKWILQYTAYYSSPAYGVPALQYTAGDPGGNSWTNIGFDGSAGAEYEGSNAIRTATGSNGVAYTFCWGGWVGSTEVRGSRCYDGSLSLLGSLSGPLPAGNLFPPHPTLFSFGNSEYWVTFDNAIFQATPQVGNMALATTPKYTSPPSWPTLAQEGSVFSGSTSGTTQTVSTGANGGSFTQTAGDLIVAVTRGGTYSTSAASITDSLGDAFTCEPISVVTTAGWHMACYSYVTHSGTATYTSTVSPSQQWRGLTVLQFHAGYLTTTDGGIVDRNITSGSPSVYTTGAFSTTATNGLVVVCADAEFGNGFFSPGPIGPYIAAFGAGITSGAPACSGTLTDAVQSNISASTAANNGAGGLWGGVVMSFK